MELIESLERMKRADQYRQYKTVLSTQPDSKLWFVVFYRIFCHSFVSKILQLKFFFSGLTFMAYDMMHDILHTLKSWHEASSPVV